MSVPPRTGRAPAPQPPWSIWLDRVVLVLVGTAGMVGGWKVTAAVHSRRARGRLSTFKRLTGVGA